MATLGQPCCRRIRGRPHTARFGERLYGIAVDGLKVTFECKAKGHRTTHDYGKDRRGGYSTMSTALLTKWCTPGGYWSREQGGIYAACPTCHRATERNG